MDMKPSQQGSLIIHIRIRTRILQYLAYGPSKHKYIISRLPLSGIPSNIVCRWSASTDLKQYRSHDPNKISTSQDRHNHDKANRCHSLVSADSKVLSKRTEKLYFHSR